MENIYDYRIDGKNICDGCMERDPETGFPRIAKNYEHRCHGKNVVILGERTRHDCECPHCGGLLCHHVAGGT
jgi:hypothetical protein